MKFFRRLKTDDQTQNQLEDRWMMEKEQSSSEPGLGRIIPVSEAKPEEQLLPDPRRHLKFETIVPIVLALVIFFIAWYFSKEKSASSVIIPTPTATRQPTKTIDPRLPSTVFEVVLPSGTPTQQFTATRAIATPTPTIQNTLPTIILATETVTPSPNTTSGCTPATEVTLADVGKTLCVTGVIQEIVLQGSATLYVFSNEKGAFYFILYEREWKPADEGVCMQATGEVQALANSPVMVLGFLNNIEICP